MRGIDPLNYMLGIAAKLRKHEASAGASAAYHATQNELAELDVHPRWRDEAPDSGTPDEYLIRLARAAGVHATQDHFSGGLRCRLTRDADDEDTIAWPGRRAHK